MAGLSKCVICCVSRSLGGRPQQEVGNKVGTFRRVWARSEDFGIICMMALC